LKNKLRFGIIGCSSIAQSSTLPAIVQSKFAELKMIGSRSKERGKKFAEEFDCKNFGSYDEVLENNEVDAVYISVPVGLHEEWTIKAAKSGKHILCEKSSSSSYESAKRMVACSKQNNVRIMEGFMFRFHPSHRKIHEMINSGYLGTIFWHIDCMSSAEIWNVSVSDIGSLNRLCKVSQTVPLKLLKLGILIIRW